ncbi:MAG: M56 family metallopeptidase [Bdellovibrionaceae bacterium]|nr:M56 family metallopeptidase [Pseudobdellovibrionaceae bacterium]
MTFIFFNLLVNSILSLAIGLMLVYFFIWFFRVNTGRWKVFLLSLPFVKIIYDFARGVPEKSVLFSGVDPFSLPPKHQLLSIGAGFDGWTPYVSTVFSVNALDGKVYNSSIGDYLLIWLHRTFGNEIPLVIVSSVLSISLALLTIRIVQYYSFEKRRRKDRIACSTFKTMMAGRRTVDIYISNHFSGTPFTGGIIKPYICLPEDAIQKLTPEELDAVIAHEMGHVRYYDLLVTVFIQGLGDLFWFIPGYRWLSRKIDRLREVVADSWAVSSNVKPHFLASALLKLKEIPEGSDRFVLYSAFFREKSLLKERVERLMGDVKEKRPRFGWQNRWVRYGVTIFISVVVLNSVFGGNFRNEAVMKAPEWFDKLLSIFLGLSVI